MRLLITTDTVGGVWTYTKELSEGLLSRGHSVLLLSMGPRPSLEQQAWTHAVEARSQGLFRYLSTEYALEWMQQNGGCYRDAEPVLLKQIELFQPDLLHLNQFCYGALPSSLPKVVIAHSDVMSWSQSCRGHLPPPSPWFDQYRTVVRRGLAHADAVVAPTRWMLRALCSNYAVPARCSVIANGRTLPSLQCKARRKLQAITVGRVWDEGKNIRMLEEITSPIPLLVAGELALESEPLFASSRLSLLGPLSERKTLTLFAESSIYIITSRYEPFGLAPLEAALSGCAIIAHDIASLREVWGGSALYFKTAQDLEALLCVLKAKPSLVAKAARLAESRARTLYSQDAMVERYLELYASLGVPALRAEFIDDEKAHAERVS